MREPLIHELNGQGAPGRWRPGSLRQRHPLRLAAGLVCGALLVAGALLIALAPNDGGVSNAAARSLHGAAVVASRQPSGRAPTPGQYFYTKSEIAGLMLAGDLSWSVLVPETREVWIGPDGSGRIVEKPGDPQFLSDQDRAAWEAAGSPSIDQSSTDQTFDPDTPGAPAAGSGTSQPSPSLSYVDLSNAPTDPQALKQVIEERKLEGGPPGDAETFTIIGDLLRETYASPELRAALYTVASELPAIEMVGTVQDAAGRSGEAIGYTHAGIRHDLIFDPKTSVLLGERDVLVDPSAADLNAEPGTVVGYAAYLTSGVVDSTSATP